MKPRCGPANDVFFIDGSVEASLHQETAVLIFLLSRPTALVLFVTIPNDTQISLYR